MNHSKRNVFGVLLSGAILLGCSTSSLRSERQAELLSDPRVGEAVDRICFTGGFAGFSNNKRDSVVMQKNAAESYLLTVRGCPLLEEADSIEPLATGRCLRLMDVLKVNPLRDDLTGRVASRCQVNGIYKWNDSLPKGRAKNA